MLYFKWLVNYFCVYYKFYMKKYYDIIFLINNNSIFDCWICGFFGKDFMIYKIWIFLKVISGVIFVIFINILCILLFKI